VSEAKEGRGVAGKQRVRAGALIRTLPPLHSPAAPHRFRRREARGLGGEVGNRWSVSGVGEARGSPGVWRG